MSATASIAPGPQYMQALQRANEVRLARAGLKRRVAGGELSVAEVLDRGGFHSLYLRDPDGHILEIASRTH